MLKLNLFPFSPTISTLNFSFIKSLHAFASNISFNFVDKDGNDFVVLPYSEYGLNVDNCKTTLTITATQGRNDKNIDPAKDRTLRIDCIIMEPME